MVDESVSSIESRLRGASRKSEDETPPPGTPTTRPTAAPSPSSPRPLDDAPPYPQPRDRPFTRAVTSNYLFIAILVAIVLAIIVGFLMRLRKEPYTKREVMYASFLGVLLGRSLVCLAVPLFLFTVISALGRLDITSSIKITLRTVLYFFSTTVVASLIACFFVAIIHPGQRQTFKHFEAIPPPERATIDYFLDLIKNLVPPNVIEACIFMHVTKVQALYNKSNLSIEEWDFDPETLKPSTNYIGLAVVALVVGFTVAYIGWSVAIFLQVTEALADVFLEIILWLLIISPLGIFCLVLGQILALKNIRSEFIQLGLYFLTVLISLFLHACVVLPLLYLLFIRSSPLSFAVRSIPIATTAFATSSSLITMPVAMLTLEEKSKADPRIVRFIIPFGTILNMDGSAIYLTVAPLFLAQRRLLSTSLGDYLTVCATANLASVGVVALPQGTVLALLIVLSTLGLPPEDIGTILVADWLVDRLTTMTNVWSDCVGAAIVEARSKKDVKIGLYHEGKDRE